MREAHRTAGARRLKCDLVCGSAEPDDVEAAARGPLKGVLADVTDRQRDLAAAAGRMIGVGDDTENLTAPQMLDLGAGARAGLLLTRRLPDNVLQRLQARHTPPTSVSTGISLCLNKRLSSNKTQHLWDGRRGEPTSSPRSVRLLHQPRLNPQ